MDRDTGERDAGPSSVSSTHTYDWYALGPLATVVCLHYALSQADSLFLNISTHTKTLKFLFLNKKLEYIYLVCSYSNLVLFWFLLHWFECAMCSMEKDCEDTLRTEFNEYTRSSWVLSVGSYRDKFVSKVVRDARVSNLESWSHQLKERSLVQLALSLTI